MKSPAATPRHLAIALLLALGCLTFNSCTVHVNAAKQASLQTGSPLTGIRPLKVFVGEFEDARGVAPNFVGHLGVKDYKLDKSVAATIEGAVRKEFERNGNTCLAASMEREADIIVNGTVYQYSLNEQVGFVTVKVMGNVGAKISVKAASHPDEVFTRKYDGSYYVSSMRVSYGTGVQIQNEALLNMLKEFTTDPEFLEFLKRAKTPEK